MPIFAALALPDVYEHRRTVDVGYLEFDQLAKAQAGGVQRGDDRVVFGIQLCGFQKSYYFFFGQYGRKSPSSALEWNVFDREIACAYVLEIEPEGADHLVEERPGYFPFIDEMILPLLDVGRCDAGDRLVKLLKVALEDRDIGADGLGGVVANDQGFAHGFEFEFVVHWIPPAR